jgi:hypothetical protein
VVNSSDIAIYLSEKISREILMYAEGSPLLCEAG